MSTRNESIGFPNRRINNNYSRVKDLGGSGGIRSRKKSLQYRRQPMMHRLRRAVLFQPADYSGRQLDKARDADERVERGKQRFHQFFENRKLRFLDGETVALALNMALFRL